MFSISGRKRSSYLLSVSALHLSDYCPMPQLDHHDHDDDDDDDDDDDGEANDDDDTWERWSCMSLSRLLSPRPNYLH